MALREQIAALVREYHRAQFAPRAFNPATDLAHYAGRVFDDEELCNLVDASLDFFLTANRYADKFEADFAEYMGVSDALLVNSGSAAGQCTADHTFFLVKYMRPASTIRKIMAWKPIRLRCTRCGSAAHIRKAAMSLEY